MEKRNAHFDLESISRLEEAIINNTANESDYENLNEFLSGLGLRDYLKIEFQKYNVWSFKTFIDNRNKKNELRDTQQESILLGILKGTIGFIKKNIISK